MAISSVNFLEQKRKRALKQHRVDLVVIILALVLLVVAGSTYGGLYYWKTTVDEELAGVLSVQNDLKTQIGQFSEQEAAYLLFYDKLTKATLLLDKRSHGTRSLIDIYRYLTTQDIAITAATYDYYTKSMEYTLKANSVFAIEPLRALVQADDFLAQYESVTMGTLSRSSDGTYQLSLNFVLDAA